MKSRSAKYRDTHLDESRTKANEYNREHRADITQNNRKRNNMKNAAIKSFPNELRKDSERMTPEFLESIRQEGIINSSVRIPHALNDAITEYNNRNPGRKINRSGVYRMALTAELEKALNEERT